MEKKSRAQQATRTAIVYNNNKKKLVLPPMLFERLTRPVLAGSYGRSRWWSYIFEQTHCCFKLPHTHSSSNRYSLHTLVDFFNFFFLILIIYFNHLFFIIWQERTSFESRYTSWSPGWAAPRNPRIGPWLRLLKKIALSWFSSWIWDIINFLFTI